MPDGTRSTGSPWSSRYPLRRQCRILPPRFDKVALTVGLSRVISRSAVSPITDGAAGRTGGSTGGVGVAGDAGVVGGEADGLAAGGVELVRGGGGTNSAWYAYSTRNDKKTAIRMRRSMATVSCWGRDQRRGRPGDDTGANGGYQARDRDRPRGVRPLRSYSRRTKDKTGSNP